MSIVLNKLVSSGAVRPDAVIEFDSLRTLIRGPSDTGKSYIRECLWYLLGGDAVPRHFPESSGYDTLTLTFTSDGVSYEIRRGNTGGGAAIHIIGVDADGAEIRTLVAEEVGELLVRLSGAEGKAILRSKSEKGPVTSTDLRHWFLITQPNMISELPPYKVAYDETQRIAAFNLFLTGDDDHAFELVKTNQEVQRITGQLQLAEEQLQRLQKTLSDGADRAETELQLSRVDTTLAHLKHQYNQRAANLRETRSNLAIAADNLARWANVRAHRQQMVDRFELLQKKYDSDSVRLTATWEGMGVFESLASVPCPLCATPSESQVNPKHLEARSKDKFRAALRAEIEKIAALKLELVQSLNRENNQLREANQQVDTWQDSLTMIEKLEAKQLDQTRTEFSADPEALAIQRSELVLRLQRFDELQSLLFDIADFKKAKKVKRVPLNRDVGDNATEVAVIAKQILHQWGFESVSQVSLDAEECDLVINGRPRLNYGAGKRGLFLSAMNVALLQHSMTSCHPHLGVLVLDSPLKAYADPEYRDVNDEPAATVTESFYAWLANWTGPGQIVVLENQRIEDALARKLNATVFSGIVGQGRPGFYAPAALDARTSTESPDKSND